VPLPWSGDSPPYGFSPQAGTRTWLDQPPTWAQYTVAAENDDPNSMLSLYRMGLRLRRSTIVGAGEFGWKQSDPDVLAFGRGDGFACVVNLGSHPVDLPDGATVLLTSAALDEGRLPPDTAAWLTYPSSPTAPPERRPGVQEKE
jgi:alpha-glucosidase